MGKIPHPSQKNREENSASPQSSIQWSTIARQQGQGHLKFKQIVSAVAYICVSSRILKPCGILGHTQHPNLVRE